MKHSVQVHGMPSAWTGKDRTTGPAMPMVLFTGKEAMDQNPEKNMLTAKFKDK